MKIVNKFLLTMVIVTILIAIIGFSTLLLVEENIKTTVGEVATFFVKDAISNLDQQFDDYIKLATTFIHRPDVLDLIHRYNDSYMEMPDKVKYIDDMDKYWVAGGNKSAILCAELLQNDLSRKIKNAVIMQNRGSSNGPLGEIFITNRFGAVIASTNKTSDFRQDDEDWWQNAKKRRLYVDKLAYDESSKSWNITLAMAVHASDGSFIGVIKVGIRAEWIAAQFGKQLTTIFQSMNNKNHFHFYLTTDDGRILYSSNSFIFLQKIQPSLSFKKTDQFEFNISYADDTKHVNVFSFSDAFGSSYGLNWILLLQYDRGELFSVSKPIKAHIATAVGMVLLLSILFSIQIWRYLKLYTDKITVWASKIGQGQLGIAPGIYSNDELGLLDRSLHEMAKNLELVTVSRNTLQLEVQERIKIECLLKQEHDFSHLLLTSTADGIYGIDIKGRCLFINNSGLTLLGFSTATEVIGQDMHKLMHHTRADGTFYPKSECPVCCPTDNLAPITEDVFWRRDRSSFPVEYSARPIHQNEVWIGGVAIFRDISVRKVQEAKLEHAANYDFLTGLPNRPLFFHNLHQALLRADQLETLVVIAIVDLDNFKNINDTFGHHVGDRLLQLVAATFPQYIRAQDSCARLAGDEFALLCENFHTVKAIYSFISNFTTKLSKKQYIIDDLSMHITASIGVTLYPFTDNAERLLQQADIAAYQAKREGKNRYTFFTWKMQDTLTQHVCIEKALHTAIEHKEFELVFQPKYHLQQESLVGMEVLLRLNSSILGKISPAVFIPIAEETGHIVEIGNWVLRTACEKFKSWPSTMTASLVMSVNVSACQTQAANFLPTLESILLETGMDGKHLELEITETAIMKNISVIQPILRALRSHGIHISIDDFGTGHSSFAYLKHLDIDILKVDRSFVCNLDVDEKDQAIVSAIISMAHKLRLHVIAEGVENEIQARILRDSDCDAIQGYFYAQPMTEEKFQDFCLGKKIPPYQDIAK